jgi:hypothetical protein
VDKKKIAAITGVYYYINEEQKQREATLRNQQFFSFSGPGPWALHSRQTMMHMRCLIQRRVLKRV